MISAKVLDKNTWNNLSVCKQISSGLFKMVPTNYSIVYPIYLMYMYKHDLISNPMRIDML